MFPTESSRERGYYFVNQQCNYYIKCTPAIIINTGFVLVQVLENLESPGILFWHFPGLESPRKKATGPGKIWKSVNLN